LKRHETQTENYTLRGNAIGDKKIEIDEMDKELKQKEIQMRSLQKEVGEVTMKLKNELSLVSTNVQNCKARINELEHTVTQSKCVVFILCFMSFQISGEEYFFGL
jgi:flagellar biosynthesis chaperone FliJ